MTEKIIEREGKSEFEIVTNFMKEFNLKSDDFTYEIIQKGSNGFLNIFGNKKTILKFKLKENNNETIIKTIKDFLTILDLTWEDIKIKVYSDEISVKITGISNPGFLIGKDGKFLSSFQHLINRMMKDEEKLIKIDVDGYKERKEQSLLKKVRFLSQKVLKTKKSITMDPLTSAERKIVHRFIEKDGKLRTLTVGQGERKRVVIFPMNQKNTIKEDVTKNENENSK